MSGLDLGPRLRLSLGLGLAGAVASASVLPYALNLQGTSLAAVATGAGIEVFALLAMVFGQGAVICLVLSWFASAWALSLGFTLPLFGPWAEGRRGRLPGFHLAVGLGTGLVAGGAVLTFSLWFTPAALISAVPSPPGPLLGLGASFYGGITEEIIARFFLLTALTGLLQGRAEEDGRQPLRFWMANALVAVLFALGHAPTLAAAGVQMEGAVWAYLLAGNGGVSLAFGWLYGRYGLETAMLGHFTTDLVLHVLAPVFG
ncbi:MAG: CPBP family glutamic-type intramembrane protease [Myxococcota bacterium]